MESKSNVMLKLHRIQMTVPDRDFFMHTYSRKAQVVGKKTGKGGRLSGGTFLGRKKKPKFNLIKAREQIKAFHNAFQGSVSREGRSKDPTDGNAMSISEMNVFRQNIRESAQEENADTNYLALDGIVKYIDLKNSAIVAGKQQILLDSLRKIGTALLEDGGLSLFHTTWFLNTYKEYLARFKIFSKTDLEMIRNNDDNEVQIIVKRLSRKQFEIPQYLNLVDDKALEVRQINNYSKDILVKMSRHGQKGCTSADIRKIFLENLNSASTPSSSKGKLNEIAIIMGYALLFARIPMMDQLVENIRNAIPNVNTDTTLYKQKIIIAQKISLLEISRALHKNDGSENFTKKLYLLALGVFKYCVSVIEENQLDRVNLKNDIYTYPLLKQAVIAITYKNIFRLHQESYLELLETSQKLLDAVKQCSSSGHPALAKMARNAEIYSKNINSIILQIQSENTAGYGKDDFGETHQNY